jgi:magnesium chelatase family protein
MILDSPRGTLMLAIARACAVIGLEGCIVKVETSFNPRVGIFNFSIVGLPDSTVADSRERVRSAIKSSGLQFPFKSYVINLSPAIPDNFVSACELAIAIGVLATTDQLALDTLEDTVFIGGLALDSSVTPVQGLLVMILEASQKGYKTAVVPSQNLGEISFIRDIQIIPVSTLGQLIEHLYGMNLIPPYQFIP